MEAEESHHQDSHRTCKRSRGGGDGAAAVEEADGATGRSGLRPWNHQSSRIFRVSRASGGKDRHSKVYTSKGLRDRRIRLSVSTAIQFYDLQDRLGCDQPSKAIEWLIKSAASSIAELPTLETSAFPLDPPKLESLHREIEQHCSSPSETSKGSVLYLSQSETRVKARERARERSATKGKDPNESINHTLNSQSSFTELLAGNNGTPIAQANPIQKQQIRYLPVAATADYFSHGGLTSLAHNGNGAPMGIVPINIEHPDLPQFAFIQDHHPMGDYSLNFSSPCLAGFNRGTLQSNSPSPLPHHQHHHIQRLSCPVEGFNLPFFLGSAPVTSAMANSGETQLADAFDGRLQLCFGDGHGVSDLKGKGTS